MDGWMDGHIGGWMDILWMDGQIGEWWMDGRTDW